MHELQQILLQKLPRLGEITFGCEVMTPDGRILQVLCTDPEVKVLYNKNTEYLDYQYEILGHPFTHADLLEAIEMNWRIKNDYKGDNKHWAMLSDGRIFFVDDLYHPDGSMCYAHSEGKYYPCLPVNISDLSLPEHEETRARLISLLK